MASVCGVGFIISCLEPSSVVLFSFVITGLVESQRAGHVANSLVKTSDFGYFFYCFALPLDIENRLSPTSFWMDCL